MPVAIGQPRDPDGEKRISGIPVSCSLLPLPVRQAGGAHLCAETPGQLHHENPAPVMKPGLKQDDAQAENEEPQPQVVVALGLRITNCAPSSPSV